MSISITVYSGFKKNINSLKIPTGGTTINATLKAPTSEMTPTFILSGFDLSWNYIKWGDTYYYVHDIVIVSNTQAEYHCEKDVLATFRNDILSSSQFVTRNANTYQPYLADKAYPALNESVMDSSLLSTWNASIDMSGYYVVGVVNPDATNGVAYYALNESAFTSLMGILFSDDILDPNADISLEIQKELVNPFQYIASVMWFPLNLQSSGTAHLMKFGWWLPTNSIYANQLSDASRVVTLESTGNLPRHPQATSHGIAMNGSPYSRFALDCWCFGHIPIDPLPFVANSAVGLRIEVDLFTGAAILTITNSSGKIVNRMSNQFGVPIQIGQFNQSIINPVANTVGAVASFVGGVVTGNVAGGVLSAASGVISAIESAMPQVQSMGAVGSKIAYQTTPTITGEFYKLPTLAPAKLGRPLMEQKTMSSLSGYTMCEHIDLNSAACPEEKQKIIEFMTSGFFIE